MYSVMIVEDELLVRMGLSGSVPWEELGMQVVAEVSDGLTALEQFKKWWPDIVLTDIRMPGMDGLSLIREIRRIDTSCAVIIITCLEDFQTLQSAMKLGISCYLLKDTMTQDDILSSLRRAQDSLADRAEHKAFPHSPGEGMLIDMLQSYLVERNISYKEFLSQCNQSKESLHPPLTLITAYIHRDGGHQSLLVRSIGQMLREKLPESSVISLCDKDRLIFLLQDDISEKQEDITRSIMEVNDYATDNLGVRMRVFLCKLKPGYQYIPDALMACTILRNDHFFTNSPLIVLDEKLIIDDASIQTWVTRLRKVIWELGYISPPVRTQYLRLIDGIETSVGKSRQKYEDALYALVVYMAHAVKVFPPEKIDLYQQCLHGASTIHQTMTAFDQLIEASVLPDGTHNREIGQVIEFIQNHLDKNITLPAMAKRVNLSPNYFSRLFKDETGKSFSDYLANIRLECAKMLLLANKSVKEVAAQCGFNDIAYFSRFFKQKTGVSPSHWRKAQ